MASAFFNSGKVKMWDGSIDLDTDTLKISLHTSSFTPNIDTMDFFDDVTNQISASGTYVSGGYTLLSKTVTQDNTNDRAVFDAADVSWTSATITARYGVIYKSTGTAATSPLICVIDFGSDKTSTDGTFTIVWSASGIFYY